MGKTNRRSPGYSKSIKASMLKNGFEKANNFIKTDLLGSDFFYCGKNKIALRKSESALVLEFDDKGQVFNETEVYKINDNKGFYSFKKKINNETFLFEKIITDSIELAAEADTEIINIAARELKTYDCCESEKMVLTKDFFLRFKKEMSETELDSFIKLNKITLQRGFESDKNLFQFELNEDKDLLEKINSFNHNEMVDYSNPNFRIILRRQDGRQDVLTDNPGYKNQWALMEDHRFDINIKKAWSITEGKSSISIAIMDDGVDYGHEDLNVNGKLAGGWDFVYPAAESDPSPTGEDTHGTHCAGVASAAMNNKGIIGVAPGCRVLGLRVAHGNPWSNSQLIAYAVDAFEFAINNEVDVMSCSWALNNLPPVLINKINEAATAGRNGKGIVICMAAGNYWKSDADRNDFAVMDSAMLDSVVSVGAYGLDGMNKLITREDLNRGEKWGSRFEPLEGVDVLAPGVQILTTDVTGEPGKSFDDYFELFNGTSASTPFVAGAAALILSVNGNLKSSRVREILIESTFENEGRLDVLKALEIAQEE